MSQKEVFAIALKVFSLWFLCWLFINITPFVSMLSTVGEWQGHEVPAWAYIAICTSFLLAGAIIAKIMFKISNSVLGKLRTEKDMLLSEADHKFVFQICGMFFVVGSLTLLPSSFSFLFIDNPEGVKLSYFFRPVGYIIQLIIGVWLVAHPSWWQFFFAKLRGRA